jgi:hypothetical protein
LAEAQRLGVIAAQGSERGKDKGHRKPFALPLPRNPGDPVTKFVQRQAWLYALAEEPEPATPAASPQAVLLELGARTARILSDLMGQDAGQLGEALKMTAPHMRRGLAPRDKRDVIRTRLMQVGMLAHIGQVREHLNELERELWLTMQLAHDPRIAQFDPIQTRRRPGMKYGRVLKRKTKNAQRLNVCLPARLVTELDRIVGLNNKPFNPLAVPGVRELMSDQERESALAARKNVAGLTPDEKHPVARTRRRAHGVGIQAPTRVFSEMTLPLNLRIVEKTRDSIPERERKAAAKLEALRAARKANSNRIPRDQIAGLTNPERAALGLKPVGRPRKPPPTP